MLFPFIGYYLSECWCVGWCVYVYRTQILKIVKPSNSTNAQKSQLVRVRRARVGARRDTHYNHVHLNTRIYPRTPPNTHTHTHTRTPSTPYHRTQARARAILTHTPHTHTPSPARNHERPRPHHQRLPAEGKVPPAARGVLLEQAVLHGGAAAGQPQGRRARAVLLQQGGERRPERLGAHPRHPGDPGEVERAGVRGGDDAAHVRAEGEDHDRLLHVDLWPGVRRGPPQYPRLARRTGPRALPAPLVAVDLGGGRPVPGRGPNAQQYDEVVGSGLGRCAPRRRRRRR